jgi:hypothetical protein
VQDIVEAIREDEGSDSETAPYFMGRVKVKPGKENNGNPDNYF